MESNLTLYPRPKMKRSQWVNLNGMWDFDLQDDAKLKDTFSSAICVPYCVESEKSCIQKVVRPHHFMHYRRFVELDVKKTQRVLLNFGAVDQTVDVYINRNLCNKHQGGYASFSIDITEYLHTGSNEIYCVVNDKTEHSPQARGKQRLDNNGAMRHIFYTPTSGIWQTVWLELVPEHYIEDLTITPNFDQKHVFFHIKTQESTPVLVRIEIDQQRFIEKTLMSNDDAAIHLNPDEIYPWTPETPHLYKVYLSTPFDHVESYFAMRCVSVCKDSHGIKRFALNHEPYYMNGVLDQGYWAYSNMTPPHDGALEADIRAMKEVGFNTIRKHVKVEWEPFYALCDQIGMLVWQDMPNGGGDYNFPLVTYLPNVSDFISRHIKDHHYGLLRRSNPDSRAQFYQELERMIHQLKHYPSIVMWVPFNEGWGQFDSKIATNRIKTLDPTRLVNEACGWFDQGGGDVFTYHSYFKPLTVKPKDRVVALSEFGGHALAIQGHTFTDKQFGYRTLDQKHANEALMRLFEAKVLRNIKRGLSASIYTQLSDVESEVNGLMTFDRAVFKFDQEILQEMNRKVIEMFKASI